MSRVYVLYALAKQGRNLGAFKVARHAFDKLQSLKVCVAQIPLCVQYVLRYAMGFAVVCIDKFVLFFPLAYFDLLLCSPFSPTTTTVVAPHGLPRAH